MWDAYRASLSRDAPVLDRSRTTQSIVDLLSMQIIPVFNARRR
jgi:hypothetical protein